jgi:DNA-binding CsgD family transcriptional regulator
MNVNIDLDRFFALPANVFLMDNKSRVIRFNQNTANLFGLSPDESIGLSYRDFQTLGNWDEAITHSFQRDETYVLKTKNSIESRFEPPIPDLQGKQLYYVSNRMPVFGTRNHTVAVLAISIDITASLILRNSKFKGNHNPIQYSKLAQNLSQFSLTKRQSECLFYLTQGKTFKEIALLMNGISVRTVETYIEQLKLKLNCRNKSELIVMAIEMNFYSLNNANIPSLTFQ